MNQKSLAKRLLCRWIDRKACCCTAHWCSMFQTTLEFVGMLFPLHGQCTESGRHTRVVKIFVDGHGLDATWKWYLYLETMKQFFAQSCWKLVNGRRRLIINQFNTLLTSTDGAARAAPSTLAHRPTLALTGRVQPTPGLSGSKKECSTQPRPPKHKFGYLNPTSANPGSYRGCSTQPRPPKHMNDTMKRHPIHKHFFPSKQNTFQNFYPAKSVKLWHP